MQRSHTSVFPISVASPIQPTDVTRTSDASPSVKTSGFSYSFCADKLKCKAGMTGKQPVVLVSCGSFNPPTIMHLRMFDVATRELQHVSDALMGSCRSACHPPYREWWVCDWYYLQGLSSAMFTGGNN